MLRMSVTYLVPAALNIQCIETAIIATSSSTAALDECKFAVSNVLTLDL